MSTIVKDLEELLERVEGKDYEATVGDQKKFRDLSQKMIEVMQDDDTTLKTVKALQKLLSNLNAIFSK